MARSTSTSTRLRDLDTAAFVIVSAAEGVAMNASPEFYRGRGADKLASLFTRYLTKRLED